MTSNTIKRRRIVYSCQQCRTRKLKCDRERPSCTNCTKHNYTCEYISHNGINDKDMIESQIKILKSKIVDLETGSTGSPPNKPDDFVNFSQIFSLSSLIKKNRDLSAIMQNTDIGVSIPSFIEESLNREQDKHSKLDLLKIDITQQGNGAYSYIMPYFSNLENVKERVNKFFDTELHGAFPYMDKTIFYKLFETFFATKIEKPSISEYIFMGQLLLILRIVSISLYNCGYDQEDEYPVVGVEAFNLGSICLEEARFPLYFQDIETIKLMLLLYDCENNSPEAIGLTFNLLQAKVQSLISTGVSLKYNIDPKASENADSIRIIWNQILDIERTDLIYSESPILIDSNSYTTSLPIIRKGNDQNYLIQKFHDRTNIFQDILLKISKMVANARNPATLKDYQDVLETLINQCKLSALESILNLSNKTKEERTIKTFKLIDFLDLHCLTFMFANRIFLYYDEKPTSTKKIQAIENVMKLSSSMISLAYFIDPHQQHYHNLREHFGYNIHLIPRILQNLHRLIQLQYTLLVKACYQKSLNPSFKLDEIQRITFQNIKVIISSFGKISDRYIYAKRLYMVHSYLCLKIYGTNGELSEIHKQSFKNKNVNFFSENELDAVVRNLTELSGDRNLSSSVYEEPFANYFESLISNSNPEFSKPFSIAKIDEFLNTHSFLS